MLHDIIIKKAVLTLLEAFISNCCTKRGKSFRIVNYECITAKYNSNFCTKSGKSFRMFRQLRMCPSEV